MDANLTRAKGLRRAADIALVVFDGGKLQEAVAAFTIELEKHPSTADIPKHVLYGTIMECGMRKDRAGFEAAMLGFAY